MSVVRIREGAYYKVFFIIENIFAFARTKELAVIEGYPY